MPSWKSVLIYRASTKRDFACGASLRCRLLYSLTVFLHTVCSVYHLRLALHPHVKPLGIFRIGFFAREIQNESKNNEIYTDGDDIGDDEVIESLINTWNKLLVIKDAK